MLLRGQSWKRLQRWAKAGNCRRSKLNWRFSCRSQYSQLSRESQKNWFSLQRTINSFKFMLQSMRQGLKCETYCVMPMLWWGCLCILTGFHYLIFAVFIVRQTPVNLYLSRFPFLSRTPSSCLPGTRRCIAICEARNPRYTAKADQLAKGASEDHPGALIPPERVRLPYMSLQCCWTKMQG